MNSLISIQILRAVAAWLVVYHHYMSTLHNDERYTQLAILGVCIFFVISGFVMFHSLSNKACSAKEFFVRRLIRIVPAYWFYTFLTVLLSLIYAKEFLYDNWNLTSLIASLFFIGAKVPYGLVYFPLLVVGWTLIFEIFFYVLLSLCIWIFGRFSFLACIFALIALPLVWDKQWICALLISNKVLWWFVYGIALGYVYIKLKNVSHLLLYFVGVALLILDATLLLHGQKFDKHLQVVGGLNPFLAFLLIGSGLCFEPVLSKIRINAFRILRYLGDISYSTYLSHTLIINICLHYIGNLNRMREEILLFLISLTILAISHLTYQYIEIGPLVNIMKRKYAGRIDGLPT